MFQRTGSNPTSFDSVIGAEGRFTFRPNIDVVPTLEVTMVYVNSETKTTYGSCPFRGFSPRTLELFTEFLKAAESDFGTVVFEGGEIVPYGMAPKGAESGEGLPKGLGE